MARSEACWQGEAVVAVVASPSLRAERSKLQVASAQLIQAGLLPNPQLTANVDPVTGGDTAGTSTGWSVGLNWEVTALIAQIEAQLVMRNYEGFLGAGSKLRGRRQ